MLRRLSIWVHAVLQQKRIGNIWKTTTSSIAKTLFAGVNRIMSDAYTHPALQRMAVANMDTATTKSYLTN